jgi:outer membrane lipoprotein-sorting protein
MKSMAGTPGVIARFHEEKQLALLSAPLEVQGILYFIPPARMVRITTEPGASRLVIDGDHVVFQDAAGDEEMDLSTNPVARTFVSNFIVLFNGDLEGLRRRYEPAFHADGDRWTLTLVPRGAPLNRVIARVTLEGAGRKIDRMELLETNGDRTTTWFEDVQVDHRFAPAEIERIFSTAGAPPPAP